MYTDSEISFCVAFPALSSSCEVSSERLLGINKVRPSRKAVLVNYKCLGYLTCFYHMFVNV